MRSSKSHRSVWFIRKIKSWLSWKVALKKLNRKKQGYWNKTNCIKSNNQKTRNNININSKIVEDGPEASNDVTYSANYNIY